MKCGHLATLSPLTLIITARHWQSSANTERTTSTLFRTTTTLSSLRLSCFLHSFSCAEDKGKVTRMWADVQRDGRPAEYRWHSLLNADDKSAKIYALGKGPLGARALPPENVVYKPRIRPNTVQSLVDLVERSQCSDEAKTRKSLKFALLPKLNFQPISAVIVGRSLSLIHI